jgi:hypothetical protein
MPLFVQDRPPRARGRRGKGPARGPHGPRGGGSPTTSGGDGAHVPPEKTGRGRPVGCRELLLHCCARRSCFPRLPRQRRPDQARSMPIDPSTRSAPDGRS